MSQSRFNLVFMALMLLGAVCAFVIPTDYTNIVRGRVNGLFSPVSYPVRRVATAITGRVARPDPSNIDDSSTPAEVREELDHLRATVAAMSVQLEQLKLRQAERQLVGDVYNYANPFRVISGDTSGRECLTIEASAGDALVANMPVLHREGVIGRVSTVGSGSSVVRLITDRGFRVIGRFGRYQATADAKAQEFHPIDTPPPLVEGRGNNTMGITNISMQQVRESGLKEGDIVVLADRDDWPLIVNGYKLGRITRIAEQARSPLWADITVLPSINLMQRGEVMVVNIKPATPEKGAVAARTPLPQSPQTQTPIPSAKTPIIDNRSPSRPGRTTKRGG